MSRRELRLKEYSNNMSKNYKEKPDENNKERRNHKN